MRYDLLLVNIKIKESLMRQDVVIFGLKNWRKTLVYEVNKNSILRWSEIIPKDAKIECGIFHINQIGLLLSKSRSWKNPRAKVILGERALSGILTYQLTADSSELVPDLPQLQIATSLHLLQLFATEASQFKVLMFLTAVLRDEFELPSSALSSLCNFVSETPLTFSVPYHHMSQ